MTAPQKRLPGQSNAEFERRHNANADFIGTQSLHGGGDHSLVIRISQAFFAWRDRRRNRKEP
ncbi:hypothetical protein [Actinomadura rudentiformis]|uniref:Uncharacterized protein n=1 Tax=Actinomadura rudentiformis TaxID=359158 RepID=A0A6H9YRC2_9ACTN|nr:hypothetical protein [Actinomadura rudentiformis]KAB2350238.1 hypothetical protein F8566_10660 [Actinomadura rudentiformis]